MPLRRPNLQTARPQPVVGDGELSHPVFDGRHGLIMLTLVIVAEADPLTEHLVLLIVAVALAGALLLIILLARFFCGALGGIARVRATSLGGRRQRSQVRIRSDKARIRSEIKTDAQNTSHSGLPKKVCGPAPTRWSTPSCAAASTSSHVPATPGSRSVIFKELAETFGMSEATIYNLTKQEKMTTVPSFLSPISESPQAPR
jgi:hypothetical protein